MPRPLAPTAIDDPVPGREHWLQALVKTIELLTGELLGINAIAHGICETIAGESSLDFTAIQLVDRERQCIETIAGFGLTGEWKVAKHSLENERRFRDIQADVVLASPPRIEIITGWDDRFDPYIYREVGHRDYSRCWVPLIVVRQEDGRLGEASPAHFELQRLSAESNRGFTLTPGPDLASTKHSYEVIGTLEAGFDNDGSMQPRLMSDDIALQLFAKACVVADRLYRASLLHVLELVTLSIKTITSADCASLHFPLDTQNRRFAYGAAGAGGDHDDPKLAGLNVWLGQPFARELQPRRGGLGEQAIAANEPKTLIYSSETAESFNPNVSAAGIQSYTAFPLKFERPDVRGRGHSGRAQEPPLTGVLNIAFWEPRGFSKSELAALQPFITLALDAIRNVTLHVQATNAAGQLAGLHNIARYFAAETDTHRLLRNIAGVALNLLAADVVFLFVTDSEHSAPTIVGRRQDFGRGQHSFIENYTPPSHLRQHSDNIYAQDERQLLAIYADESTHDEVARFIYGECFKSGGAVMLKVGDDLTGIMFINYRHIHFFSDADRDFIETLASTAAIAIKSHSLYFREHSSRLRMREEVWGEIRHELQHIIGPLNQSAPREVSDYHNSAVKRGLESCMALMAGFSALTAAATQLPAHPVFEELTLGDLIRSVVNEEAKGNSEIFLKGPTDLITRADSSLLRFVLSNGLRNAIEAVGELAQGERDAEIVIDWGASGDETWLTVVDNGPGIRVNAPFKVGRTSKGEHHGIGLPFARQCITSMGGDIKLKSGRNFGARFEICWWGKKNEAFIRRA